MVKFINHIFGTEMWVAEDRVEEYKAAGHKLVANPTPTKQVSEEKKSIKKAIKKG